MPYTPVSCGTGHSFRDTRTMPYAYWSSECQSERALAWRENAFWTRVLDCGRETDAQMIRQNIQESEQRITTEGQIMLSGKGRMILLFNSTILRGDCHFERWRINNNQSQRSSTEEKREKNGTGQEQYGWDWRKERFVSMSLPVLVLLWCLACDKFAVALSSVESLSLFFLTIGRQFIHFLLAVVRRFSSPFTSGQCLPRWQLRTSSRMHP